MSSSASSQLDRLEAAAALRADALQRMQHALGVVGPLGIARDLRAQRAVRRRMVRVAVTLTARPSSTVTSIAQVSGQSCGQAARTRRS